jgi:signal transduction histidine kinase
MIAGFFIIPAKVLYKAEIDWLQESVGALFTSPAEQGNVMTSDIKKELNELERNSGVQIVIFDGEHNLLRDSSNSWGSALFSIPNNGVPARIVRYFLLTANKLFPYRIPVSGHLYFYLLFDHTIFLQVYLIVFVFIFISLLIGGLMIAYIGGLSSRIVLKQINSMNNTVKMINSENMDLRIDVGEMEYELQNLAVTINAMIDGLQESYNRQKQFVSDVSHELRTPVSVVSGYANMLLRWGSKDEEVLKESISAIKNESDNMADLIEKLLFLARYDNQNLMYEFTEVDLSAVMNEVYRESVLLGTKHHFTSSIQPNIIFTADENRIKQAVRVFVDNAVKYTPEGGHIGLSLKREGYKIILEISDGGIGISKGDLKHIFERFYRADKARNRASGGYGLGLSMARLIVSAHGGIIKVKSKVGEGSSFTILFDANTRLKDN